MTRPTACGALQDAARDLAPVVELGDRHDVLVAGDLEDGVGRRVDDGPAGGDVLVAELVDDAGAGGRPVAEHAPADGRLERLDHLGREAVGIRRERAARGRRPSSPSGRWSCPCRRRAPRGGRRSPRPRRSRAAGPTTSPSPSPARLGSAHVGALEHVPQRVRAHVAVGGGVGQLAGAAAVEHADEHARHAGSSSARIGPSRSARPAPRRRRARGCVSRKTSRRCSTVT